jgi:hypothetical protein
MLIILRVPYPVTNKFYCIIINLLKMPPQFSRLFRFGEVRSYTKRYRYKILPLPAISIRLVRCGRAKPSYTGQICVTPSPESTTTPIKTTITSYSIHGLFQCSRNQNIKKLRNWYQYFKHLYRVLFLRAVKSEIETKLTFNKCLVLLKLLNSYSSTTSRTVLIL